MPSITVLQTDQSGWYVGTSEAYESPLQPGVYLMPAGATELELPPEPWPADTTPRLVGGRWVMQARS